MYTVGICGHFGGNKNLLNGQTVKTKILTEEIKSICNQESVKTIDTHGWKKKPLHLLLKCFYMLKECKNVIILPAHNGIKVFVPLFLLFNKIFNRKLHYVVIGGWLPDLLEHNSILVKCLSKYKGIYVETYSMIKRLNNMGLKNVYYLPNFKRLNILKTDELIYSRNEPYKLCTFSRVMKEKGIEDAIYAVEAVNKKLGRTAYTLDIYGQIDDKYSEHFNKLRLSFKEYIYYGGCVQYNHSTDIIKNYFALLFPTYYEGEGFAGTILDAFSAGVPVIGTDWKYNSEIIKDKKNGLIYSYKNSKYLYDILMKLSENPNKLNIMKEQCIYEAKQYSSDIVVKKFVHNHLITQMQ